MKKMAGLASADWQWENATAGAVAGLATVTFSHPLDVVRARFQVYDGRISNVPAYRNTPHALFTIARTEIHGSNTHFISQESSLNREEVYPNRVCTLLLQLERQVFL
ncbi:folate transporter 1, chloroplastic [Nicotiana attenuata]|uniref:Folate transporter 1, chloroplastic n=1 Tax=Nicotiana attenuata TaxID=49451 RepID=A0A1J6IA85_NICAT|nr:folate transporter 1, chloroplastic [Nicotiana attenuata]